MELRQQVQRLWDRGDLLRLTLEDICPQDNSSQNNSSAAAASLVFPYRLKIRRPMSRDMGNYFSEVREWIQSITDLRYTRLELQETRHPQLGRNDVPQSLWIDFVDDAIAFIGKRDAARHFCELVLDLINHDERLLEWVRKRPVKVLELAPVWERLLSVHERIVQRQGVSMYLRQLSVTGVDTKFIEAHRGTLTEWLDLTLPASAIDTDHRGSRGFIRRYGFKDKPARLRIRSLDSAQPLVGRLSTSACDGNTSLAMADVTFDVDVIRSLDPGHSCVLITENEINYLVLPERCGTLAVFGSGYGLQSLGEIDWLQQRDVWYWGDIDTHGFAILNELRRQLPNVRSLMMNRDTLMAHESLWGIELKPANRRLESLTDEEVQLYQDLLECRYGKGVRLEQERIDYKFMLTQLQLIQPSRRN